MHTFKALTLVALGICLGALATPAYGQQPGNCSQGTAQKDLDINNVRARVFNTGSLAYGNGAEAQYVVPKASGNSPIYASGIWIGGKVDGDLRVAGATYSDFEFWPGPLGADARPVNPSNCSEYDHIYKVSNQDILDYEATGQAAPDLANWPAELGAPVIAALNNNTDDDEDGLVDEGTDGIDNDGDGFADERDEQEYRVDGGYDLAAGDRPDLIGDQAVWWVMNDVGATHDNTETPPIGVEVQVHGWAFNRADALGNTTFFKYTVNYKGSSPLEDAYLSIFSDPDLGDAGDDYVGSDTSLSLGFVYNANETDGVYGTPPATGYDFFQGPIVDGDTLGLTRFFYFINGGPSGTEDPSIGEEFYNIMEGFWVTGVPLTQGGLGYQTDGAVTKFAYTGDPVTEEFWSEVNVDGSGADNQAGDRRFVMTTGPFTINPGDSQDIVFGIVHALGSDNINSVAALRAADILAQSAYNNDFELPTPPPAPPLCDSESSNQEFMPGSGHCLYAAERDGQAVLSWGYPSNSSNYLGSYDVFDRFLAGLGLSDTTYSFEGFNVYRYPTSGFSTDNRELVATYDIVNGVTRVTDPQFNADVGEFLPAVSARGSDSGLQYSFVIDNVTNYTDYYYGVSAYAYSPESTPRVLESSPTNITVRPADLGITGTLTRSEVMDTDSVAAAIQQQGDGQVTYRVVDPGKVTGSNYRVEFFEVGSECGIDAGSGVTSYSIIRESDGTAVLDGCEFFAENGMAVPQQENVIVADGLSFSVTGPSPGPLFLDEGGEDPAFLEVQAPGGGAVCPDNGDVCPLGDFVTFALNSTGDYFRYHVGAGSEESLADFGSGHADLAPHEYEIRVVAPEEGSYVYHAFTSGNVVKWPVQVWDVGTVVPGQENDPSDDVQMIVVSYSDNGGECEFNFGESDVSGYAGTDRIYAYYPATTYDDWHQFAEGAVGDGCEAPEGAGGYIGIGRPLQREALFQYNAESIADLEGTIIRYYTVNPNLPGDTFSINTDGLEASQSDSLVAASLDDVGIVPNPYKGQSAYEVSNLDRRVRFVNLPETVTIRIYTVSGSLVRTLYKDGPGRSIDWDLTTENSLPVASGMYFIHVDAQDVGERVLKFGVINRQNDVEVY